MRVFVRACVHACTRSRAITLAAQQAAGGAGALAQEDARVLRARAFLLQHCVDAGRLQEAAAHAVRLQEQEGPDRERAGVLLQEIRLRLRAARGAGGGEAEGAEGEAEGDHSMLASDASEMEFSNLLRLATPASAMARSRPSRTARTARGGGGSDAAEAEGARSWLAFGDGESAARRGAHRRVVSPRALDTSASSILASPFSPADSPAPASARSFAPPSARGAGGGGSAGGVSLRGGEGGSALDMELSMLSRSSGGSRGIR